MKIDIHIDEEKIRKQYKPRKPLRIPEHTLKEIEEKMREYEIQLEEKKKQEKHNHIKEIIHSYLDTPCNVCAWVNKDNVCMLEDCNWVCKSDKIEDMATEIMEATRQMNERLQQLQNVCKNDCNKETKKEMIR